MNSTGTSKLVRSAFYIQLFKGRFTDLGRNAESTDELESYFLHSWRG